MLGKQKKYCDFKEKASRRKGLKLEVSCESGRIQRELKDYSE